VNAGADLPFAAEVAGYLADCAASTVPLNPAYHPTEDSAVKLIYHRRHTDREADQLAEEQIRAAYRAAVKATSRPSHALTPAPSPLPVIGSLGGHASLTEAALAAAARGWHVFPLRPGDKQPAVPRHKAGECDRTDPWCRAGHQGWEPRATADAARIAAGWAGRALNVGIATGPSGLVVIDLDVPKPGDAPPPRWALPGVGDGADVLALLCEERGEPLPFETLMVRTRRGGLHLYFQAPPGAPLRCTSGGKGGGLGWLIDTRAWGGYVVGPGSIVDLPDGSGRYELAYDREPAPLPLWLASLLTAPRQAAAPMGGRSADPGEVRALDDYVRTALHGECERVRAAEEGGRTWALNKAGYKLGRLIAAGALPEDLAESALLDAATVHFGGERPVTLAEARASVRGGIAAGKRRPRDLGPAA
jgi:Bifunctional DNA primase/polymerase, N-terminal